MTAVPPAQLSGTEAQTNPRRETSFNVAGRTKPTLAEYEFYAAIKREAEKETGTSGKRVNISYHSM